MNNVIAVLKGLKEEVDNRREFGDIAAALRTAERAIDMLNREYLVQGSADEATQDFKSQIEEQLAEWLGVRGGLLRRQGRFEEARASYAKGADYEEDDSYNLVNAIVMGVMADAGSFDGLRSEIAAARSLVDLQVDGSRHDQWWAWADAGLLRLLDEQFDEAFDAYEEFKRLGPRRKNYASVSGVLGGLSEQFVKVDAGIAEQIDDVVDFLRDSMPSS